MKGLGAEPRNLASRLTFERGGNYPNFWVSIITPPPLTLNMRITESMESNVKINTLMMISNRITDLAEEMIRLSNFFDNIITAHEMWDEEE